MVLSALGLASAPNDPPRPSIGKVPVVRIIAAGMACGGLTILALGSIAFLKTDLINLGGRVALIGAGTLLIAAGAGVFAGDHLQIHRKRQERAQNTELTVVPENAPAVLEPIDQHPKPVGRTFEELLNSPDVSNSELFAYAAHLNKERKHSKALELYHKLAQRECIEAKFEMAQILGLPVDSLNEEERVQPDQREAIRLFGEVVNSPATWTYRSKEQDKVVERQEETKYLKKLACQAIGNIFLPSKALNVEPNREEATKWFSEAVKYGDTLQIEVVRGKTRIVTNPQDLLQAMDEAFGLNARALPPPSLSIGKEPIDKDKGKAPINEKAELNSQLKKRVDQIVSSGIGGNISDTELGTYVDFCIENALFQQAHALLQLGVKKDNIHAKFKLARLLKTDMQFNGKVEIPADPETATKYFQEVVSSQNSTSYEKQLACQSLGQMHLPPDVSGPKINKDLAKNWFIEGLKHGQPIQIPLGFDFVSVYNGRGIDQTLAQIGVEVTPVIKS